MDVELYLQRINYRGSLVPNLDTLRSLHRAHMFSVPFENLDIHLGRTIVLDEELFYEKIVGRKRGGFCYELNGLFAALLRDIGYDVTTLSARVADGDSLGPDFDHMCLLVQFEARWLVDVGFGESFVEPLLLIRQMCKYSAVLRIESTMMAAIGLCGERKTVREKSVSTYSQRNLASSRIFLLCVTSSKRRPSRISHRSESVQSLRPKAESIFPTTN